MVAKLYLYVGWFVLLLMTVLYIAAWLFPQEVMTGIPTQWLLLLGAVLFCAIVASFAMRKR
jgi:hypothetical protein